MKKRFLQQWIRKLRTKLMSLRDSSNKSKELIRWYNDLSIHPGLKFSSKFKCPDFEKYYGKSCSYAHLRVYKVANAQYGDNDKLLVQTFSRSLTGAATWFIKLDIAKINEWII